MCGPGTSVAKGGLGRQVLLPHPPDQGLQLPAVSSALTRSHTQAHSIPCPPRARRTTPPLLRTDAAKSISPVQTEIAASISNCLSLRNLFGSHVCIVPACNRHFYKGLGWSLSKRMTHSQGHLRRRRFVPPLFPETCKSTACSLIFHHLHTSSELCFLADFYENKPAMWQE